MRVLIPSTMVKKCRRCKYAWDNICVSVSEQSGHCYMFRREPIICGIWRREPAGRGRTFRAYPRADATEHVADRPELLIDPSPRGKSR